MNSDRLKSGSDRDILFTRTFPVYGIDITRIHWRELSTTMENADGYARDGRHWMCITTEYQTTGRGTHGRTWTAPAGSSLMMSLVLPPPAVMEGLETLSVETAELLRDVLSRHALADYIIKHPNDLLIGGKKCAGIMYESVICDGVMSSLVLGMGVNLTQSADDFADAVLPDATSLKIENGFAPDRETLIRSFLEIFVPFYESRTGSSMKHEAAIVKS